MSGGGVTVTADGVSITAGGLSVASDGVKVTGGATLTGGVVIGSAGLVADPSRPPDAGRDIL